MNVRRAIPARVEEVEVRWIYPFHTAGFIRGVAKKTRCDCWWCHRPAADEGTLWLAYVTGKGNKLFCSGCAALVTGHAAATAIEANLGAEMPIEQISGVRSLADDDARARKGQR